VEAPEVENRQQLISFIFCLLDDHDACGDQWKNPDNYTFLQAMAQWLNRDADSRDGVTEQATWQLFADALAAASEWK
jgi:hypothetical protein